jgi:hypothetical protein
MSKKHIDMVGVEFGTVRVVAVGSNSHPRSKSYVVECVSCGRSGEMLGGNIRRAKAAGNSGCQCGKGKHGLHAHPLYKVWNGMMWRCHNEKHAAYENYGGRGIYVCSDWHNVEAFVAWGMANGWRPGLQIDRINNDEGYTAANCRFVTPSDNQNNRRSNRFLVVVGQRYTVAQAARRFGLGKTTIKERLRRGWPDESAVRPVDGVRYAN